LLRACGLSINDFEVLLRLDQEPAPGLRLGDLTQTVRLSQPALSRMIARLERRGLLSRSGDPSDRRGVIVSLTDAGAATLRAAVPVHARTVREALLDRLSPDEHNQLTEVLGRIAKT
jgi:DNA-binding MarR family transcriptional regulator